MGSPKTVIQSLSRGLSILSNLSESQSSLSLTELSNRLRLSKSTTQRLSNTLQHLGYLERDVETKKFRLGSKVLNMGFSIMRNLDLRKVTSPYLEEASREIGETVNLAILDGTEILYVERIKTQQILNINLQVGSRLPVYCTAMGKAILAFLSENRSREILEKTELQPLTPYTIARRGDLRKEIERVRARGFATNNEELSVGLRSVAAPVRNFTGEVIGAVNIAVPSIRVSVRRLEMVLSKKVVETANKISYVLGYHQERDLTFQGKFRGNKQKKARIV